MERLTKTIQAIGDIERNLEPQLRGHLDSLTKPPGSLGKLEDIAVRYGMITGTVRPSIGKKRIVVFAGDHGVVQEGVSAFPGEVTPQMVRNMLDGGAAVNVLARHVGAEVQVVDIGVNDPLEDAKGLIRKKVRSGTRNIAKEPAMTIDEAVDAITVGINLAEQAVNDGVTLLGTGEMGIANTTPSSALFAALLDCSVEEVTGRGTGIDDDRLKHKLTVIKHALNLHKNRLSRPLDALAALGGLEIAGICGLILGASAHCLPVVVDGFISSAGALVAAKMCPTAQEYLFYSHCSAEAGHRKFFKLTGIKPLLDLDMRLGEGTGAALAMHIIEGAVKLYNEMATFGSAGVSDKELHT